MDLILIELSFFHPAGNAFEVCELMIKLLLTCREAKKFEFNILRVNESFSQYYTIFDWLQTNRPAGIFKKQKQSPISWKSQIERALTVEPLFELTGFFTTDDDFLTKGRLCL